MATTANQGLPYPLTSDAANVPSWLLQLAQSLEVKLNMIFSTTAARDAAITSPTNGMEVFITGTGEKQVRAGGAWVVIGGRASSFAMAAGNVTMTWSGGTTTSGTISFPASRFSIAPLVQLNTRSSTGGGTSNGYVAYQTHTVTTTSCGFVALTVSGSGLTTGTLSVDWLAVQMTSSSAGG